MGRVAAGPPLVLLGAVIQEEDGPAQKRSTDTMSTADNKTRNPSAYLCTHTYPCGNGKV